MGKIDFVFSKQGEEHRKVVISNVSSMSIRKAMLRVTYHGNLALRAMVTTIALLIIRGWLADYPTDAKSNWK